jgi:amino acid permease
LVFILPLCLLRDMTPLAFASLISVASMVTIVGIVIYIYFECPDVRKESTGNFYENWIEIRPGVLSNLGTFIFTFVSQHTVHLVFGSLKPPLKTVKNFKIISSISILAAATVSLLVGVFVYITFWQDTKSDIFEIYPQGWMIDTAKLLLCVTMVFTFPLPFFTCRELLILVVIHPLCGIGRISSGNDDVNVNVNDADTGNNTGIEIVEEDDNDENDCLTNLQRPLLLPEEAPEPDNTTGTTTTTINAENINDNDVDVDDNIHTNTAATPTKNWLLPDDDRQLRLPGHAGITFTLWLIVTALAIAAPNLGDILDLTGCASGTLIAFVIPALLSFYIEGYNHLAMVIFTVGGVVGTVGTFYSIKQLIRDL